MVTVDRAMTTLVLFERWNKVRRCLIKSIVDREVCLESGERESV